jgi:hypothetical protein
MLAYLRHLLWADDRLETAGPHRQDQQEKRAGNRTISDGTKAVAARPPVTPERAHNAIEPTGLPILPEMRPSGFGQWP